MEEKFNENFLSCLKNVQNRNIFTPEDFTSRMKLEQFYL